MRRSNRVVVFATSNMHKLEEVERVLAEFGLEVRPVRSKGVEIQADELSAIAAHASRVASRNQARPVFVEDAGLFIDELNGFPGPYSSYVYRKVGLDAFLTLLGSLRSRSATFRSSVAFCAPRNEPLIFEGEVRGVIARRPRGTRGFGFDPVFKPKGSETTMAEMTIDEKNSISHRGKAVRKFARWFLEDQA